MPGSPDPRYLPDVNILMARNDKSHVHHGIALKWFHASPDFQWALCAFTESGFLRNATAPRPGQISMIEATAVVEELKRHPGYRYLPIAEDWQTLCSPFFPRLQGTKQVTDAYLLGLCVREGLILVTMDRGILHLAGEQYRGHVLLLQA